MQVKEQESYIQHGRMDRQDCSKEILERGRMPAHFSCSFVSASVEAGGERFCRDSNDAGSFSLSVNRAYPDHQPP